MLNIDDTLFDVYTLNLKIKQTCNYRENERQISSNDKTKEVVED